MTRNAQGRFVKKNAQPETTLDHLAQELRRDATAKNLVVVQRYFEQKKEGVVNPIVLAALLDVRPQMIYNYIRKGKFTDLSEGLDFNNTQKRVIRYDEANTFAQQFVGRREAKAAKIEAELEGAETE
jgi:hypothetical protein